VGKVLILERGGKARASTVALVAHDEKKEDLLRLVRIHRDLFRVLRVVATGTTGTLLAQQLGLAVQLVASGPHGGDLQIGAMIVEGRVDALIFLRDPLTAHPHEPDIQALMKVCDVHCVPVATNVASAEILLYFPADRKQELEARP
jgi:methylglyoxal synthase